MDESVFNVINYNYNKLILKEEFSYDFLNHIDKYIDEYEKYYKLLNSIDQFKLKNIYQFLYLRSIKINKKYKKINQLDVNTSYLNSESFNEIIKKYINNDLLKSIIIMNGIQQYFIPCK